MIDGLEAFMKNPTFREVIENSPSKECREFIEKSLVYGMYCGSDPSNPKTEWEKNLTAEDWKYILDELARGTRMESKCRKKIQELGTK